MSIVDDVATAGEMASLLEQVTDAESIGEAANAVDSIANQPYSVIDNGIITLMGEVDANAGSVQFVGNFQPSIDLDVVEGAEEGQEEVKEMAKIQSAARRATFIKLLLPATIVGAGAAALLYYEMTKRINTTTIKEQAKPKDNKKSMAEMLPLLANQVYEMGNATDPDKSRGCCIALDSSKKFDFSRFHDKTLMEFRVPYDDQLISIFLTDNGILVNLDDDTSGVWAYKGSNYKKENNGLYIGNYSSIKAAKKFSQNELLTFAKKIANQLDKMNKKYNGVAVGNYAGYFDETEFMGMDHKNVSDNIFVIGSLQNKEKEIVLYRTWIFGLGTLKNIGDLNDWAYTGNDVVLNGNALTAKFKKNLRSML